MQHKNGLRFTVYGFFSRRQLFTVYCLLLTAYLLLTSHSSLLTSQSIGFSTIDAAGGKIESANYQIRDTVAQPAVGLSESANYQNISGAIRTESYSILVIAQPVNNSTITGTAVVISGTAKGIYFKEYKIEYGKGEAPDKWELITTNRSPVESGPLAEWSTKDLAGKYSLKLTVYDTLGNTKEEIITVNITNEGKQIVKFPQLEWIMVSLPLIIEDATPEKVFNITDLKIYYWDPTAKEDPAYLKFRKPDKIEPGRAYWVKVPQAQDLTFTGNLISQTQPYEVAVYSGWNQIGNPFIFDIAWGNTKVKYGEQELTLEAAVRDGIINEYIYWYETGGYIPVDKETGKFIPTVGYFVYAYKDCKLMLQPIEVEREMIVRGKGQGTRDKRQGVRDKGREGWELNFAARCGKYNDLYNFIGQSEVNDVAFEPPPIGEYVRLYFVEGGKKYAILRGKEQGVRDKGQGFSVAMVVETNIKDEEVNLSWAGINSIPPDYDVLLVDNSNNHIINMRQQNSYRYKTTPKKEFIIKIGKFRAPKKVTIEKVFTVPNPSKGKVTFILKGSNLNEVTSPLKVEIYNIRGDLVKTESLSILNSAFSILHSEVIDLSYLANGVYIYRVTLNNVTKIGKLVIIK